MFQKLNKALGMSEKILENSPAAERESLNDGQDRERKSDLYQRVRVVTDKVGQGNRVGCGYAQKSVESKCFEQ